SDGDGISDAVEGLADSDGDGLLDYLDAIALPELMVLANSDLLRTLATDTGLQLLAGRVAAAQQSGGVLITEAMLLALGLPTDADFAPLGIIADFGVNGLTTGNRVAQVVLPLPVALPPAATWRYLGRDGRWYTFAVRGGDALHSAPSVNGQCPTTDSPLWQAGLQTGHDCVRLTITDGGANDVDGIADGIIAETASAPAVARRLPDTGGTPTQSQSGGGSADVLLLVLLMLTLGMRRARRKEWN
ncbi:MAG: hypothetical protein Q8J78_17540, partial [Moraxellaceae bacterium]|nr:hypothetical protein [Moraxellaceae bacterium]